MQSSDPRTWTDFSNPAAHGFVKVDCNTLLERSLKAGAIALGIAAAVMLLPTLDHDHRPILSGETLAIVVTALALGALVLWLMRALTDNFYLIDRARHAVYFHSKFLLARRVRLLLERQDILATSAETRRRRSRYRSWWEYRAVLVDSRGRTVPMGDWERDGLWTANNLAREIATELGCPCYESPADSRLVVRRDGDRPTVTFEAYRWFPW